MHLHFRLESSASRSVCRPCNVRPTIVLEPKTTTFPVKSKPHIKILTMSNEDTSLPAPSPPPRDDTSGYVSKANIGFSNDQGSIFSPRDDAATDDDDTNNCNVEISQIHSSTDHISSQPQPQSRSPPKIHLVIANIQKIANIRSMMKAAIAFGCHSVIVVGQHHNSKRPNFFPPQFQKARSSGQIQLHQFSKWKECVDYLKTVSMYLVGVEIDERSRILDDTYFDKYFPMNQSNVGLLMGNEGQGIIQQYLKGKPGPLNIVDGKGILFISNLYRSSPS